MKKPLVSIITVNYDTPKVTAEMLASLNTQNYDNFEIIVVDNASPKLTSEHLKKDFPFIIHITSPKNLGFAGGNNLGLAFAKGEYIFLANNDTEFTPDLMGTLVEYLENHPECGIACPKIKYHFMPDTIQYAGAVGLSPLTSRSYDIGYLKKDDGTFDDCRRTDLPNGAAMMMRRSDLEKVGQMSEIFFLYYEELDWAYRFKKAGLEVHYVGTASIFHKESVSTGKNSAFKSYYLFRNRLLYIRRNYPILQFLMAAGFFTLVSTPVHMLKHALKKEWGHSKAIFNALKWNLTHSANKEPSIHSSNFLRQLKID
ncbi:MAG: glycosyltransferase family 2 protein [Cytophagaceae bacterium]|nr:glycosyltransferase family 2 protein [Cytophagaceae bacterium]MBL0301938.1 glycosyltransferase family 2 protein [Cytophagaceae bacterium]